MSACPINWRRGRDSNPRYAFGVHTLSRRAPSTARTPLPGCNGYRPAAKALKGKPERPPTQRRARRTPCCCAPRAALPIMRAMKTISRMGRETGVSIERDASARSRLVCRATMRSCAALVALLASVALHAQEWTYTYTSRANTAQTSGERPLFGREAASLQPLEDAPSRNSSREPRATVAGPHVQVATDPDFTYLLQDHISHDAQLVAPALPPGDYYLRVRLRDDAGVEGHDTVHRFRVEDPVRAPLPVAPSNDAKMARLPLWLTWSATPAAPGDHLQVAEDASFTRNLVDIPSVVASYYDLGNQFPIGVYYCRVPAIGRGGLTGTYSAPRRFEVGEEQEQVVRNEPHAADSCAAMVSDDQIIAPLERTSTRQPCGSPHGRTRDTGESAYRAAQALLSPP